MKRIALTAAVVLSPLSLPTANAASLPGTGTLRMAVEGSIDWAQIRRGGAVRRGFVARVAAWLPDAGRPSSVLGIAPSVSCRDLSLSLQAGAVLPPIGGAPGQPSPPELRWVS